MLKPADYYAKSRKELLPLLVPVAGATILDIGCGEGGLGKLLKENGCGMLYGIEPVDEAAQRAQKIYDTVFVGPIEQILSNVEIPLFDIIVCADVLEHLVDPWAVLSKLRDYLKPEGRLIASIPNIRNGAIIGDLLRGSFDYRESGILDRTHLRFFTLDGMKKLFRDSGFSIQSCSADCGDEATGLIPLWKNYGLPAKLKEIVTALTGKDHSFTDKELLELSARQMLFKVGKNPDWKDPQGIPKT